MREGYGKGSCPLCKEKEDVMHILLICSETRKQREQFLSSKYFNINKNVAFIRE
jgi:hypothetical protein